MNTYIVFKWKFKNQKHNNYTICDTVQECRKNIERQYACTAKDYEILSKQIRDESTNKIIKEEI